MKVQEGIIVDSRWLSRQEMLALEKGGITSPLLKEKEKTWRVEITAYWQGEERRTEDLCKRALSFSVKWGANESEGIGFIPEGQDWSHEGTGEDAIAGHWECSCKWRWIRPGLILTVCSRLKFGQKSMEYPSCWVLGQFFETDFLALTFIFPRGVSLTFHTALFLFYTMYPLASAK